MEHKMQLQFTPSEFRQLSLWAEHTISGGHFGDGDVILPEEAILLEKIEKAENGQISVSEREIHVLLIWAENVVGGALKGMIPEEISIIDKLQKAQLQIRKNSSYL